MRRLLIVSYFCPPQPEAAAIRIENLARHISSFGWEAVVVTRFYPIAAKMPFRIVHVVQKKKANDFATQSTTRRSQKPKSKLVGQIARFVRGLIHFPDASINWLWPAINTTLRLSKEEHFDAVLTTHGPATEHIIGYLVARRRGIPWVADYRDLWTGNPFSHWGPIHRFLASLLEKTIVAKANAVTAVTGLASELEILLRRKIIKIPNGTNQTAWNAIPRENPRSFQFCHAGSIYPGRMSPELLFKAVSELRRRRDPAGIAARFVFLGPNGDLVNQLAARYKLEDSIVVSNTIERTLAMQVERQSAVLLLLIGWEAKTSRVIGSKIVEYMGAERAILAIGPADSAVGAVLRNSGLGQLVSTDVECIQAVREAYNKFAANEFSPKPADGWKPWTGADLARRFSETLDGLCGEPD